MAKLTRKQIQTRRTLPVGKVADAQLAQWAKETAIEKGLRWVAKTQSSLGHWTAGGYPTAMTALAATPANRARRLGYVYIPMGMNAARWTPPTTGALTELSPSLAPLAPHLDYINVLTNTELKRAYGPGNHATGNAAFLSTVLAKKTEGSDYERRSCVVVSVDSAGVVSRAEWPG